MISPKGEEFSYALRFGSYHWPELAKKFGALKLRVYSDSQLVVNQVKGDYEAYDEIMRKYLDKVKRLISDFEEVTVEHISRVQIKKADVLSKLASSSASLINKKVLVEVLKERNFDKAE